jgi:hypothetical protein
VPGGVTSSRLGLGGRSATADRRLLAAIVVAGFWAAFAIAAGSPAPQGRSDDSPLPRDRPLGTALPAVPALRSVAALPVVRTTPQHRARRTDGRSLPRRPPTASAAPIARAAVPPVVATSTPAATPAPAASAVATPRQTPAAAPVTTAAPPAATPRPAPFDSSGEFDSSG